jgi:hypothetical protein
VSRSELPIEMHRPYASLSSHVSQAVTAGVSASSDEMGNGRMRQMLKNEAPWWNSLRNPELNGWLQLFLKSQHFKRWYDDDQVRLM